MSLPGSTSVSSPSKPKSAVKRHYTDAFDTSQEYLEALAKFSSDSIPNKTSLISFPPLPPPQSKNEAPTQTEQKSTPVPLPPPPPPSPPVQPLPPPPTPKQLLAIKILPILTSDTLLLPGKLTAQVITPTTPNENYENIRIYINNSQAHDNFGVKILKVAKLTRVAESLQNMDPSQSSNDFRMMLWHGTKPDRVQNITETGFLIPELKGQMFGTGIYFADRVSKSAQYCSKRAYCCTPQDGEIGFLFLCEVQLGRIYIAENSNHEYTKPPSVMLMNGMCIPCDSIKCIGRNGPDLSMQPKIEGVVWPMGGTKKFTFKGKHPILMYNEYIVYNRDQVKLRYVVKVEFTKKQYFN